jgi:hypothetical protein
VALSPPPITSKLQNGGLSGTPGDPGRSASARHGTVPYTSHSRKATAPLGNKSPAVDAPDAVAAIGADNAPHRLRHLLNTGGQNTFRSCSLGRYYGWTALSFIAFMKATLGGPVIASLCHGSLWTVTAGSVLQARRGSLTDSAVCTAANFAA